MEPPSPDPIRGTLRWLLSETSSDAAAFLPGFDASKEKNDWAALDLRARLLLAEGQEKQDASALRGSWELTQAILADKSAPSTNRETALQRAVELMPLLTKELGRDWLRQNFKTTPRAAREDSRPTGLLSACLPASIIVRAMI